MGEGLATLVPTGVEKSQIASGGRSVGISPVVCVQQHQPFHALGVGQCPVDGRRPRCVVRDEDDWPELQLCDDGVEVADLIVRGVRVAGRVIRIALPRKSNATTRRGGERWGSRRS